MRPPLSYQSLPGEISLKTTMNGSCGVCGQGWDDAALAKLKRGGDDTAAGPAEAASK